MLCPLVTMAVALTFDYMSKPTYASTARYVVSPDAAIGASDVLDSINILDKRSIVTTYAAVLNSDTIFTQSIVDLKLDPVQVEGYLRSAIVLPETNVLEVTVEGSDPQLTMIVANSIGKQAISYIDGLNQGFNIRVLDPAQMSTTPISPDPVRDVSLAIVFGVVLGVSLAIVREQLISPIETFLKRNTIDQDSGVFTRHYFDQKTDEMLARSALIGYHTLGLVYLDGLVDFLGVIPKPLEEHVLRQVAKILNSELRGNDMIGRWDNSTFSVLLPGTPIKAAMVTFGRVQTLLSVPISLGDSEMIELKPKIGLAERSENETSSTLRKNAERALEQASFGNTNLVSYMSEKSQADNENAHIERL